MLGNGREGLGEGPGAQGWEGEKQSRSTQIQNHTQMKMCAKHCKHITAKFHTNKFFKMTSSVKDDLF